MPDSSGTVLDASGNPVPNSYVVFNSSGFTRTILQVIQGAAGAPGQNAQLDVGVLTSVIENVIANNPSLKGVDGVSPDQNAIISSIESWLSNSAQASLFVGAINYNQLASSVESWMTQNVNLFKGQDGTSVDGAAIVTAVETFLSNPANSVLFSGSINYTTLANTVEQWITQPAQISVFSAPLLNYIQANPTMFQGPSGIPGAPPPIDYNQVNTLVQNYISSHLSAFSSGIILAVETEVLAYIQANTPAPSVTVDTSGLIVTIENDANAYVQSHPVTAVGNIPSYASNAAAIAGGLHFGDIYNTGV